MKFIFALLACLMIAGPSFAAPAPSGVPVMVASPAPVMSPVVAPAPVVSPEASFLDQVMSTIHKFGGASMMLKISLIVMLLVSSMKVSLLNQLVWSKLGAAQAWIAPLLGLIAGVLDLGGAGGSISLASLLAYVSAGAGAIILHQLLDSLKAIPGLGSMYVSMIDMLQKVLGGPKPVVAIDASKPQA